MIYIEKYRGVDIFNPEDGEHGVAFILNETLLFDDDLEDAHDAINCLTMTFKMQTIQLITIFKKK